MPWIKQEEDGHDTIRTIDGSIIMTLSAKESQAYRKAKLPENYHEPLTPTTQEGKQT